MPKLQASEHKNSFSKSILIIVFLSLIAVVIGLIYPLLAISLRKQGFNEEIIGLNAAVTPLSWILTGLLSLRIIVKFGSWKFALGCVAITEVIILLIGGTETSHLYSFFGLRFAFGICVSSLFIIGEAWINQLATENNRGRILGLYTTSLFLGYTSGHFILSLTGSTSWLSFIICSLLVLCLLLLLIRLEPIVPDFEKIPNIKQQKRTSPLNFLLREPILLTAVGVFAFFDSATISFLPLYCLSHGFSEAESVRALGVLTFGSTCFQYPIGILAERMSTRFLMNICSLLVAIGGAMLPLMVEAFHNLFWIMLFIWGGIALGIYTLALKELGERFSGTKLLAGNAAFQMMWGVGSVTAPIVTGKIITQVGSQGFSGMIIASFIMLNALINVHSIVNWWRNNS